ncbi:alpha-1,6-mannosyltransferase [Hypoxylon texense]
MVVWGKGLLQSEDDNTIIADLSAMFGFRLLGVNKERETIAEMLNGGLLAQKFDRILSPAFQPNTSHHKRERVAIILGILAMEAGATIESRHLTALKVLRPWLPNMEQQLQLVTALDEYKNDGTPWVLGSKSLSQKMATEAKTDFDLGDEFWFSGLGHSLGEKPTSETASKMCLNCGEKGDLLRCSRCKMARYCNSDCQRIDWSTHKKVCQFRAEPRSCPVPDVVKYEDAPASTD